MTQRDVKMRAALFSAAKQVLLSELYECRNIFTKKDNTAVTNKMKGMASQTKEMDRLIVDAKCCTSANNCFMLHVNIIL